MPGTVLTYSIRADASQATGELKRVGAAINDMGGAVQQAGQKIDPTEAKFLRMAKTLGVDLSGAAAATVSKLEALKAHLEKTNAPAADLERVNTKLLQAQNNLNASLQGGTVASGAFGSALGVVRNVAAGLGVTFGALAVGQVIREMAGAAQDFDKEWTKVNVILRNSPKSEIESLKQKILELPPELGNASKNAAALYQILSSGVSDPKQALILLTNAAIAASGGFTSTEIAAKSATAVLNAYGLTADKSRQIFDVMAKTVDLGVVSFEELASQLGSVIPIAAANNVSFEEVSAAIASLTLVGVPAAEAVTGLRSTLTSLISPSKQAQEVAERLGIQWDANALQTKGLAGVLAQLQGNTKLTSEDISKLTGRVEATNSVMALTSSSGSKALKDSLEALALASQGAGASMESHRKASESLGKQLDILWTSVKNLAAGMGSALAPALASVVREWNQMIAATRQFPLQYLTAIVTGNVNLQEALKKAAAEQKAQMLTTNAAADSTRKLTPEIDKASTAISKTAETTKKASQEFDKLQSLFNTKLQPSIKTLTDEGTRLIQTMQKQGASAGELEVAMLNVSDKIDAAAKSQSTLAQRTEDWIGSAELQHAALMRNVAAIDRMRAATIALADAPDPLISTNGTLEAQMHHLGNVTEGWRKLQTKIGGDIPAAVKPAKQSFEEFGRQISTISTDLSKGLADAFIHWKGFGETMKRTGQEFGSAISRTFMESMLEPLTKEDGLIDRFGKKLSEIFEKVGGKIQDFFGKLFNSIENFMGTTIGRIMGAVTGAGIALGGYKTGNKAMSAAGGALMGAEIGSFFGPWGTAIGAGLGAAGGWIAGMFGARGRDKRTATGGAEDLSSNFWEGTFEDAKAGRITIDDALAELNKSWDNYVKFLNDNLKDQTVIQRSIDSQRITLTEGTAALEKLREQLRIDSSVSALKQLGAQFLETGQMTDAFAKAITDAGGSVDAFTRISGEVQRLQGLRNELGALKQMVDSFLPKQKTWMENFFETGEITEDMARKIREAGGDIAQFKKFADMKATKAQFESLVAEFNKTGVASEKLLDMILEFGGPDARDSFKKLMAEAQASGKSIGELAKDSEASTKVIQAAFDATGQGINKAFTDAAQNLSDTLAKMDENLGKAIGDLQTAMVTMIQNLINVILGVPGAAEKAARDANFFLSGIRAPEIRINVSTHFDDSGLREAEARARALANIGFNPPTNTFDPSNTNSNTDRSARDAVISDPRTPRFAEGTNYVPRTGLALVHQGEAIIPAGKNWTGGNITLQFTGNIVANNPEELMGEIERYLATNRDGARVRIQKALRLKESGAF